MLCISKVAAESSFNIKIQVSDVVGHIRKRICTFWEMGGNQLLSSTAEDQSFQFGVGGKRGGL